MLNNGYKETLIVAMHVAIATQIKEKTTRFLLGEERGQREPIQTP